jgi:tRNA threonylcarbamoyladenosine biosynthesis protein TsaE
MDLYRLQSQEELLNSGIVELFYDDAFVIIEWPFIAADYLPERYLVIKIEALETESRNIELTLNA